MNLFEAQCNTPGDSDKLLNLIVKKLKHETQRMPQDELRVKTLVKYNILILYEVECS